jgi:hypothetical protein
MREPEIISRHDFKQCPHCEETETVTGNSWKATHDGKMPSTGFVSLYPPRVVQLVEEQAVPGTMIHVQVCFMDICAGCGLERCTRVEVQKVEVPPAQPGMVPSLHLPRRGSMGFGRS